MRGINDEGLSIQAPSPQSSPIEGEEAKTISVLSTTNKRHISNHQFLPQAICQSHPYRVNTVLNLISDSEKETHMSGTNGKKAIHVATFSGWYRFEQNGKEFRQTKRDLSYWTLTCMAVDQEDPKTIYAGTEHSGLFYTKDAGTHWQRADPQVPKMFLYSALALNGGVMVGTIPSAV